MAVRKWEPAPKRYVIYTKGQTVIVATAKQAHDEIRKLMYAGVRPESIKANFNAALLDEYEEEEALGGRKVSVRTVPDRGRVGVKKPSTRATKPRRNGHDLGGDIVSSHGRRHLRAY